MRHERSATPRRFLERLEGARLVGFPLRYLRLHFWRLFRFGIVGASIAAFNLLTFYVLKDMLDRSGIKWRVLVISACYSGSFVDALKDERTLVVTAAAADKTSFGCSNENDFTYFGDAYINTALREDFSFVAAFERAKDIIARREAAENLIPSEPQIYLGAAMKTKLHQVERRFAKRRLAAMAE